MRQAVLFDKNKPQLLLVYFPSFKTEYHGREFCSLFCSTLIRIYLKSTLTSIFFISKAKLQISRVALVFKKIAFLKGSRNLTEAAT